MSAGCARSGVLHFWHAREIALQISVIYPLPPPKKKEKEKEKRKKEGKKSSGRSTKKKRFSVFDMSARKAAPQRGVILAGNTFAVTAVAQR